MKNDHPVFTKPFAHVAYKGRHTFHETRATTNKGTAKDPVDSITLEGKAQCQDSVADFLKAQSLQARKLVI
jgi:hypothetical protein